MNKIFKILALILLGLTVTSCELFSPKFWAEVEITIPEQEKPQLRDRIVF